ncbi:MAG: choice-of-anchor D domain-containing protein [bacterium]|nr:choice-of-anchor D domain-containing protein [bacterium]
MPLAAVLTSGSMRRFALRTGLIWVCLIIGVVSVNAQLTVRFVPFSDNSQIDGKGVYPRLRTQITVTHGATPVTVTKEKVFIVENNLMVLPDRVTALPGNVALVEWISTNKHDGIPTAIFVVDNGETGLITGAKNVVDASVVVIKDSTSRQLYGKIDFGRVPAGRTDTFGLKIAAARSPRDAFGNELNTRLDSVRTRTNAFRTEWIGAIIDKTPPPVDMVPAFDYRLNLLFTPVSDAPVSDILTAYYSNGFREDILLIANPAPYPRVTILQMISPNGGEQFAPCQKVVVRWKGMDLGFAAYLELSTNNGGSWSNIDSTSDSSYVWTVPAQISDSAKIRVSQKLQSNFDRFAIGQRAPTTTVAFSPDGSRFAVGYTNRKIVEFSAIDAQLLNSYDVADVGPNSGISAITYITSTNGFVAAISTSSGSAAELQRFTTGTAAPVARMTLPRSMAVSTIGADDAGTTVYVVPQFRARILTFAAASLDSGVPIVLNAPASVAVIEKNLITVMQLDGSVVTYDATTKQETQRTLTSFALDRYPVIRNIDVSQTGLAALGGQAPAYNQFRAQNQFTYVLDRASSLTRQVIHRGGVPTQVACSFSPTARYLGLGFMGQEQFELHDVESGQRLTSLTGASGHNGFLSDLDFSPSGNAIVSTSIDSSNNVLLKRFTTPEDDQSDGVFGILPSRLATADITLPPVLLGRSLDTSVSGRICNTGSVPVVITSGSFQSGRVFTLPDGITTDTLLAGACLNVHILALVTDTGRITDTLRVQSCGIEFRIPFEMRGIDHSLSVVGDLTDFGEVCVGQRLLKKFIMIRNTGADSVRINNTQVVGPAQFRVLNNILDTTIAPGGTLEIDVEFAPTRTGFDTATLVIRYADQNNVRRLWRVTGRGAGADVRVSHTALPFIPEVPTRSLTIHNSSDNAVTITSGTITSGAPFTLLTTLPIIVGAHDSATLSVRYDGGAVSPPAVLALQYEPCAASRDISLSLYKGSVDLSIPVISADPRENTSIPILAVIREEVPYNGTRVIDGAFSVDQQLFLAQEIQTTVGKASIVSQEIVNDRRIVRFTIEGSFGDTSTPIGVADEIARISGPAGLGRADSSLLVLDTASTWFGASVSHTFADGVLLIVNPNPGRKILERASLAITSIQPNPAQDFVIAHIHTLYAASATVHIVDANSSIVMGNMKVDIPMQTSKFTFNVSSLAPGVYTLVLSTDEATVAASFIVVR